MKFNITKNKKVNLKKLDDEIKVAMNFARWEDALDKKGYSGLVMVENNGEKQISIVWTDDGINGYIKGFSDNNDVVKIKDTITKHK